MEFIKDKTNRDLGVHPNKCRICGAEGEFQTYLAREMMQNTRDEFEYFVCPDCGCLQIREVPENLGKYYGAGYYSFSLKKEDVDRIVFPPITGDKKILDVGCGSGYWLVDRAKEGNDVVYGCDPFLEKDLNYQNRVIIRKCSIHEMEGTFDAIQFSDSFEHMTDPHEVMDSIHRLLKEDGVCKISIPVFPNIAFDMLGPHWYQLDAPRHIFLHSLKSMDYLTRKHELKIASVEFNSNGAQFIRSTLYKYGIPYFEQTSEVIHALFDNDKMMNLQRNAEICNEKQHGDHACFYIQRA